MSEKMFNTEIVYLKDVSVESPQAPAIFFENKKQDINFELNSNVHQLENGMYNGSISIKYTVSIEENVALLIELTQSGLFNINGFNEAEIEFIASVHIPNIIFPYISENINSLSKNQDLILHT